MPKKLLLFICSLLFIILNHNLVLSEERDLIPLKKPKLTDKELNKKVLINILKPLQKPKLVKNLNEEIQIKEVFKKETNKPIILIPKKKPLIAGKTTKVKISKSKFYSKKDFAIAKKAFSEMKKANWTGAIKIAKKAKDKSIYNFIQWRHLLTKGNKASFYDYLTFIKTNEDYPRIGRIRYLAEHKLSNNKIKPNKIIDWFQGNEPLSGYGKMILGESYILTGKINEGKQLIKEGWITADLSKSDLRFFRKKFKKHLNADDYIKRADYLAWDNKYWDLKRMLRYLPKIMSFFITHQLLMSKSYG